MVGGIEGWLFGSGVSQATHLPTPIRHFLCEQPSFTEVKGALQVQQDIIDSHLTSLRVD